MDSKDDIFGAEASDSFKVTVIAAGGQTCGAHGRIGQRAGGPDLDRPRPTASITKYQVRHKAGTSFSQQ